MYFRLVVTRSILPDPSRADLPIRGRAPQSVQNMYLPGVCRGIQRYTGVQRYTHQVRTNRDTCTCIHAIKCSHWDSPMQCGLTTPSLGHTLTSFSPSLPLPSHTHPAVGWTARSLGRSRPVEIRMHLWLPSRLDTSMRLRPESVQ